MKNLSKNTIDCLKMYYHKGYRYIATDKDGVTWAYIFEPFRGFTGWVDRNFAQDFIKLPPFDYGTSWSDKEPTNIAKVVDENA